MGTAYPNIPMGFIYSEFRRLSLILSLIFLGRFFAHDTLVAELSDVVVVTVPAAA